MSKKEKQQQPPVSLEVYRQLVFDVGAELMSNKVSKEAAANYLFLLADRPIKKRGVKAILEHITNQKQVKAM